MLKCQCCCGDFQPYCGTSAGWNTRPVHHDGLIARPRLESIDNYLACLHGRLTYQQGSQHRRSCTRKSVSWRGSSAKSSMKPWPYETKLGKDLLCPEGQAFKSSIEIRTHDFPFLGTATCQIRLEMTTRSLLHRQSCPRETAEAVLR